MANDNAKTATLADIFARWTEAQGFSLEDGDATGLLMAAALTGAQREWLEAFSRLWDASDESVQWGGTPTT